jgi:opacity protein-like surface antigen
MKRACTGVLLVACLAAAPAWAELVPGQILLEARLVYTTQSLGDINDDIGALRTQLLLAQAQGVVSSYDWDDLGAAPRFELGALKVIAPTVTAGLEFGYQGSSRDHHAVFDYDDGAGNSFIGVIGEKPKVSVWDVVAVAVLSPTPAVELGAQLGIARGTFIQEQVIDIATTTGGTPGFTSVVARGEWHGTGVTAGLFAGYVFEVSPVAAIVGRLGYRYRNVGAPDGEYIATGATDAGPVDARISGPPTDFQGREMDLDLSGVSVTLGLQFRLSP